jgi:tRNA threonylcarbamoyladenosine biosynthesis protein TsaE
MLHIHSNSSVTIQLRNLQHTDCLGRILAQILPSGTTIALNGTLGAGKTRLVKAFAIACGVDSSEIGSPTFVLCREYRSPTHTIYHADAYRLTHPHEFLELGAEEWFESSAIVFLEWAEKVQAFLPQHYIEITINVTGETSRELHIQTTSNQYAPLLHTLVQQFATCQ